MNSRQLLNEIENATQNMSIFYQQDFINYRGKDENGQYYTEVISKYLLDNIHLLNSIKQISRKNTYNTPAHNGEYTPNSNRLEEITAMDMYNQSENGKIFDGFGRIIDYQTPLKNKKDDIAGKIDLLSYDGATLRILELKKEDSTETMLRCVLEGYTYMQTVDKKKLLSDFNLPENTRIKASPLVFRGGIQYNEFMEKRVYLHMLMKELDSEPFFIRRTDTHTLEVVL